MKEGRCTTAAYRTAKRGNDALKRRRIERDGCLGKKKTKLWKEKERFTRNVTTRVEEGMEGLAAAYYARAWDSSGATNTDGWRKSATTENGIGAEVTITTGCTAG